MAAPVTFCGLVRDFFSGLNKRCTARASRPRLPSGTDSHLDDGAIVTPVTSARYHW